MDIKYISFFLLILFSCNESTVASVEATNDLGLKDNDVQSEQTANSQFKETQIPEILVDFIPELSSIQLPFYLDKDSLVNLPEDYPLNLEQIEFLTTNFTPLEKNEGYYIGKGIEIYKLKANGTYDAYLDSLDLAQVKDIVAYPYGRIELNEALGILWRLDFSSYEACPYYSGTELYLSVIADGKCVKSILLAEEWAGGDPPAFGEFYTQLDIDKKAMIDRSIISLTFEEDELIDSTNTHIRQQLEW